jgi:hypothetical protein
MNFLSVSQLKGGGGGSPDEAPGDRREGLSTFLMSEQWTGDLSDTREPLSHMMLTSLECFYSGVP